MKFKPIHWILIAVFLIEVCTLGVWLGTRKTNNTSNPENPVKQTELLLAYDANEDGSFNLLSLFANIDDPNITFKYDEKEYAYNIPLIELTDAYSSFEKYQALEQDATEELWVKFKEQVNIFTNQRANQEHAVIDYIRNVASSGYNVPHEQLYNNLGAYTINASTTINNWQAVFADYIIRDDHNNVTNELALGATVRIGDKDYNAILYTIVNSDGDTNNDSTAPEVSVHILFGDNIISDIATSEATIYYLKPDGSEYFAHSNLKVAYTATGNEARYRDLLILGGLQ